MPFSGEKKPFWLQCQIGEVFNASFPSDKKKEKPLAYNRVKVFKNGPSKICGRQPLKNLSSTNFTWSIFECFVPIEIVCSSCWDKRLNSLP